MNSITFSDRPSNVILNSINRLCDAKNTGALQPYELSKIIELEGNLFANQIKRGKVDAEEIEAAESLVEIFRGPNGDKYFNFPHKNLQSAASAFLEGDLVAIQEAERRNIQASPVLDEESYTKGFTRIS